MPLDATLTEDLGTEYDEIGDVDTVQGSAFIRQTIVIQILETTQLRAPSLTDTAIEEQRGSIESAVRNNEFTELPVGVTVDEIDVEEQRIDYTINTARVSLPISVD